MQTPISTVIGYVLNISLSSIPVQVHLPLFLKTFYFSLYLSSYTHSSLLSDENPPVHNLSASFVTLHIKQSIIQSSICTVIPTQHLHHLKSTLTVRESLNSNSLLYPKGRRNIDDFKYVFTFCCLIFRLSKLCRSTLYDNVSRKLCGRHLPPLKTLFIAQTFVGVAMTTKSALL